MSIHTPSDSAKVTVSTLLEKKRNRQPITCLTAYDYVAARLVDEAGIDIVLVGDSLAQAVLGYENTLPVTMDEMLHHTKAVRRGLRRALLVADMPFGTYHSSCDRAILNAARFLKEGGAEAVKMEGGQKRYEVIRKVVEAEIPVMGHIGLTPQSIHAMGGYKVQGRSLAEIEQLMKDATALDHAGVFSIVLEGIPREVAQLITDEVSVPTIGIGAGPDCDGQVLVYHDLLGLNLGQTAKFVRQYADVGGLIREALTAYKKDVEQGAFPGDAESYHLPKGAAADLQRVLDDKRRLGLCKGAD